MIDSYTSLQTAVAARLKRNDLAAVLPTCVELAERVIFRELPLRSIEAVATGTTSGDTVPIPAVVRAIQRIELQANGRRLTLDYTSPAGIADLTLGPDVPTRYTVEGGLIWLLPSPAGPYAYSIFHIPNLDALSSTNASNWLLLNHPDVYFYGTLMEAADHLKDAAARERFGGMFGAAVESTRSAVNAMRFPVSGGLQMKPRGYR